MGWGHVNSFVSLLGKKNSGVPFGVVGEGVPLVAGKCWREKVMVEGGRAYLLL